MGKRETVLYALTGLLAGLLSGFLGSGGGMAAAPMFMGPLKLPPERALATSIFLLLPLCALSAFFYGRQGLDIMAALPFLAGHIRLRQHLQDVVAADRNLRKRIFTR